MLQVRINVGTGKIPKTEGDRISGREPRDEAPQVDERIASLVVRPTVGRQFELKSLSKK